MTLPLILWMFMNVLDVYSVYYGTSIIPVEVVGFLLCILFLSLISAVVRWVVLVRRQYGGNFQMNILNVEEYTFVQYMMATLLYPTAILIWNLTCGGFAWQNMSAATFIYYVALSSLFAVVIIGK